MLKHNTHIFFFLSQVESTWRLTSYLAVFTGHFFNQMDSNPPQRSQKIQMKFARCKKLINTKESSTKNCIQSSTCLSSSIIMISNPTHSVMCARTFRHSTAGGELPQVVIFCLSFHWLSLRRPPKPPPPPHSSSVSPISTPPPPHLPLGGGRQLDIN